MRTLKYIPLLLCFLLVGQGCNDVLNHAEPTTSTDPENVLTDAASINSLRAAMYDSFHGFTFTTRMFLGPDALADNSYISTGATRFFGLNNNYGTNGVDSGLNNGSYGAVYDVILSANALINGVPDGVLDETTAAQYRGEALAIRAFAMHYLTRVLGYEPGQVPDSGPGEGFNLGIIIRTNYVATPEDVKELPRNTITEVYDQIISDLTEAESLLAETTPTSTNYASQAFAQAILARVNLYAGNYEEADTWATEAITTSGLSLVTDSVEIAGMFNETSYNHPESILTIATDPSTESLGVNDAINVYTANQWLAQTPTQSLMNVYSAEDNRLGWYGLCSNEAAGGYSTICNATHPEIPSVVVSSSTGPVTISTLESRKWHAEQGQFADSYPLIRIGELKLIQAEARYQTQGVTAGLVPLNELRTARGLTELTSADFGLTAQQQNVNPGLDPFIAEILTERRRELAYEGHRFFDLKRLGLNIPDSAGDLKISYESHKILDNISPAEIETNEELVQNPGY